MNRREFLHGLGAGALALSPALSPRRALAQGAPVDLDVASRTIEVNGKAARVFGLVKADGTPGLIVAAGRDFDVSLSNRIEAPTLIHWHGLTPPWDQDGVPDNPRAPLAPGERRRFTFPLATGGTHWMHAHTLQEQNLLAAPLLVRTPAEAQADEQEVVVLLHDFSFTPAEEILARLRAGGGDGPAAGHAAMGHAMPETGTMPMSGMPMSGMMMSGTAMGGMDLNDIDYDAYLANDRTLEDPQVIAVEKGGRVRLRLINGATGTAFTIATGALEGELIAVDGQAVQPLAGRAFPVAMGQRLDIRLALPAAGGAFPILALREGGRERTGIVLASAGAEVAKIPVLGGERGPVLNLDVERALRAVEPPAARTADRRFALTLEGGMAGYRWGLGGAAEGLAVRRGERVEIAMRNASMMAHPMHLHGHHFQVTEIDGTALAGALRDTVLVPPGGAVTIAFDAVNPGRWPFHCHHLYHMAAGMMGYVAYEGVG